MVNQSLTCIVEYVHHMCVVYVCYFLHLQAKGALVCEEAVKYAHKLWSAPGATVITKLECAMTICNLATGRVNTDAV